MAESGRKSKKPSGTKAESLLESTVFLADHCLGRGVATPLRAAGLTVEIHSEHFKDGCLDAEWLPVAGARGWVVLTKDKAIRKNPIEIQAVRESRVRMFALASGNMTGDAMAQAFLINKHNIGIYLKKYNSPFIASVSRSGLRLVYPKD